MKKIGKTIGVLLGLTALAGGIVVGTVPSVRDKARDWTLSVGESIKDKWDDIFNTVPGGPGSDVDDNTQEPDLPEIDYEHRENQLNKVKSYFESAMISNPNFNLLRNNSGSPAVSGQLLALRNADQPIVNVKFSDGTSDIFLLNFVSRGADGTEGKTLWYQTYYKILSGETLTEEEMQNGVAFIGQSYTSFFQFDFTCEEFKVTINDQEAYVKVSNGISSFSHLNPQRRAIVVMTAVVGNQVYSLFMFFEASGLDNENELRTKYKNLIDSVGQVEFAQFLLDQSFKGKLIGSSNMVDYVYEVSTIVDLTINL